MGGKGVWGYGGMGLGVIRALIYRREAIQKAKCHTLLVYYKWHM